MKNKLLFAALLYATTSAHASCGSSFCAMNTNWDIQGLVNNEGLRVNLRYSYARANTLRGSSPVVARDHAHQIGDAALTIVEQNQFTELGDIRVVGNYKSDFNDRMSGSGIRFGLKLPTGKANWEFISGSGTPAKSGLQPDSGSTDLVLGAYYYQDVANLPYGWFVSGIGTKVNLPRR